MKMIPGTGDITNYGSFISTCQQRQMPYKIPVNSLADVQLYIDIGTTKPSTVAYELIHTCGPSAGQVEILTAVNYVVGQDANNRWYGVFKNLTGASLLECFVIAITLDEVNIYFSEEYCIEPECSALTELKGCYGNLDSSISVDCQGIYFGVHAGTGFAMGDTSIVYEHKIKMRRAEVNLSAIRNTFKSGRTRNFRTEKEKIYEFLAETVPEWYIPEVDSIFYRGEVFIGGTKYLLAETQYEKIEECLKIWKPTVTLRDSCYQSFSCEPDPCLPPGEDCCDPVFISASVIEIVESGEESGPPITPPPAEGGVGIVIVDGFVDGPVQITGTTEAVTGLVDGSTTVTCLDFADARVFVMRGGLPLPGIDPGGGLAYYTKNVGDTFITFSVGLVGGEQIYIETIPE